MVTRSLADAITPDHCRIIQQNKAVYASMASAVDKLHSVKLKLCLLCERKMELEHCLKHPEKALQERVKLFCAQCWASNNNQCKPFVTTFRINSIYCW